MKKLSLLFLFLLIAAALVSCQPSPCEHRDADDDALCDSCGAEFSDGDESVNLPCEHRDADDDALCDKCAQSFTDGKDVADEPCQHKDANADYICDECEAALQRPVAEYVVNFTTGTGEKIKPLKVKSGSKIELPTPKRVGYEFLGWFYIDVLSEKQFTSESEVLENLFLSAKWRLADVTYEDFGAVGDGKTNDFKAIYDAHVFANENGVRVLANPGATYYISDTKIDGVVCSVPIKTDTVWGSARFIIDDSNINYLTDTEVAKTDIFTVYPTYSSYKISGASNLEAFTAIRTSSKTLPLSPGCDALVIVKDKSHKVFRRYGSYSESVRSGQDMIDVFLVDKDGNISDKSPVTYDFTNCSSVTVYKIDDKQLTITGGIFTTRACALDAKGFGNYKRGIYVTRSNTRLEGVEHYVEGEISLDEYKKNGTEGASYRGFFYVQYAANVEMKNCVITGRRYYGSGTYDLCAHTVVNLLLDGVTQSNFFINEDGTPSETYTGISSMRDCWGITGTNFSKTITVRNSVFSRFDAHCGLYNGSIEKSKFNRIQLTGTGSFKISNSEFYSPGSSVSDSSLVNLRADYGSTWDGDIEITNVTAVMRASRLNVLYYVYHNWYFGYTTCYPNVTVDNLKVKLPGGDAPEGFCVKLMNTNLSLELEENIHLPTTEKMHPIRDPKEFTEDKTSYENLNPVVPPSRIKITNNTAKYNYLVPKVDFFAGTKFVTSSGLQQTGAFGDSFGDFVFLEMSEYVK